MEQRLALERMPLGTPDPAQAVRGRRANGPPSALRPHRSLPSRPQAAAALVGGNGPSVQIQGAGRGTGRRDGRGR